MPLDDPQAVEDALREALALTAADGHTRCVVRNAEGVSILPAIRMDIAALAYAVPGVDGRSYAVRVPTRGEPDALTAIWRTLIKKIWQEKIREDPAALTAIWHMLIEKIWQEKPR